MKCSLRQRGIPLEELLSLLKAKFDDAEREYQHTDLGTASEEVASIICASAPRKNTSASCSRRWPPWVQVKYLCNCCYCGIVAILPPLHAVHLPNHRLFAKHNLSIYYCYTGLSWPVHQTVWHCKRINGHILKTVCRHHGVLEQKYRGTHMLSPGAAELFSASWFAPVATSSWWGTRVWQLKQL